jgi:glutamate/tyrosine decarboxylase-like PLP-dependent enzyme
MSPVVSQLEAICEEWLGSLFGLPADTVAGFVSGSSTATICGLAAGRNDILTRLDWDVNLKGLFGAPEVRIVLGEQAHSSVFKALSLLGFGEEQFERVPVDGQGCLRIDSLPELNSRTIVIVQAGNVNSGAFDAHKTLNAPYDCGIILCGKPKAFASAMQASGAYIQYSEKRDGMLYTPQMSRRARAVELWAALKSLGRNGIEELVDRLCDNALQFAEQLHEQKFNILNDVVFNQILVLCDTHEQTHATLKNIQDSGECWCGGSVWNGEPVIRISVCSWVTTANDINRSVEAFVKAREKALATEDIITALPDRS